MIPSADDAILRRYEALLHQTHDLITVMDLRGYYLVASSTIKQVFNVDDATMHLRHYRDALPPEEIPKADAVFARLLNGEAIPTYERVFRRHDGATFIGEVNVSLIRDAQGNPREILSIVRDISERKRIEAHLIARQREVSQQQKEQEINALRADLLVKINHEFRTPLAIINTYVGLMQRHFEKLSPEKRQDYLQNIQANIHRLSEMLDDLYVIYQTQSGAQTTYETFDMLALVHQIVAQLRVTEAQAHHLLVHTEADVTTLPFFGYERLMWHSLNNLIGNAIHYSPPGSLITIALAKSEHHLHIRVIDNGVGIPADDLPRVLEPFYRGQNADIVTGTGLGLSVVQEAVRAHGGTISIESEVQVGTTVTIQLPVVR